MNDAARNHAEKGVRLREIRKKRKKIFRITLGVIAVAAIGLLSWHTHASAQRIKAVHVEGAYLSNPIEVQRIAEDVLDGSTAYIFSNRYPWLVPLSRVRAAIEAIPSIDHAEIRIAQTNDLSISLIERVPVAIACKKSDCSLVDEQGISIGSIDKATTTLIRIDTDALGESDLVQRKLIDSERTSALIRLIDKLKVMGLSYNFATIIDPDQCLLTGASVPALKVAFKTIEGAPLRIQTAIDAGVLVTDSKAVSYIDARFEKQVSYMPLNIIAPITDEEIEAEFYAEQEAYAEDNQPVTE